MATKQFETVDEYIQTFPADAQAALERIRQTIQKAAPEAKETISYNMPTFVLDGTLLVYFAAWKHHVALYHIPAGDEAFQKECAPYVNDKGALLFPLDKPVPYDLVEKVIRFRMQEN